MGRFLIRFSYFGTRYSGLQRQTKLISPTGKAIVTVEGALKNALQHLMPANDFKITLSSRTDKGVHALRNACHVDLEYPEIGKEYIPEVITNVANFHLRYQKHDIRILETRRVSDNFHARFWAIERRYLYRIAHIVGQTALEPTEQEKANEEMFLDQLANYSIGRSEKHQRLPFGENLVIPDVNHIKAYRDQLDISKLIKAAELLSGIHNYSSFSRRISQQSYIPHPVKLMTIGVKRGLPFGFHMFRNTQHMEKNIEFWDIHLRAHSFLFRQVRRMVGAMVLVAKGIITMEDLQETLDKPHTQYPFSGLMGMNEHGLFLTDVCYKPEDLQADVPSKLAKPSLHSEEHVQAKGSDSCEEVTDTDSNLSNQGSITDEKSQHCNSSPIYCLSEEMNDSNSNLVPNGTDNLSKNRNSTLER